jgi:hypothetical protein
MTVVKCTIRCCVIEETYLGSTSAFRCNLRCSFDLIWLLSVEIAKS